jgi:hypothetical protein
MHVMSADERDKKMSEIASIAAEAFSKKYDPATNAQDIKIRPQEYLQHTIPYLTVRTLHRHEKALKSLEADSRWIKYLTLVLVGLTVVLAILTIALVYYGFAFGHRTPSAIYRIASANSDTAQCDSDTLTSLILL